MRAPEFDPAVERKRQTELSTVVRALVAGFLKLVGLAFLVGIGIFYLRLGWFVTLIWLVTTIPAYLLTRRQLALVG